MARCVSRQCGWLAKFEWRVILPQREHSVHAGPLRWNKNARCGVITPMIIRTCGVAQTNSGQALSEVSNALLLQFDKHDLVGLGEWHNSREDQDLRIGLLRNPRFPAKVRNIVVECGNAFYQETLDRFIDGEDVPEKEVQHVWRDTTQSPVAVDSPACEDFLNEVRSINLKLPKP